MVALAVAGESGRHLPMPITYALTDSNEDLSVITSRAYLNFCLLVFVFLALSQSLQNALLQMLCQILDLCVTRGGLVSSESSRTTVSNHGVGCLCWGMVANKTHQIG